MDEQRALIQWLSDPAHHPGAGEVERISTHISEIFLVGDLAYKLKRAVTFPYIDFSTLAAREAACRDEIAFNRRTAPDLYLDLVPVSRAAGGFRLGDERDVADWLVRMKRFDQRELLANLAGERSLDAGMMEVLAESLCRFHDGVEIADGGGAAGMAPILEGNAAALRAQSDILGSAAVETLVAGLERRFEAVRAGLDGRKAEGKVRHGHGDLHLGNIVRLDGVPTPFDALEFDRGLAEIDTHYDLAFALMDLDFRSYRSLASVLFNRYLELSGDYDHLECLPLFMALRAAIRAHVLAAQGADHGDDARRYLDLAGHYLTDHAPHLVAVGGLSGTGKSTLARWLAPAVGPGPGAVVLRSDVIRKRLWGAPPTERLPDEGYSAEMTEKTFATLYELAGKILAAGRPVIADAVFAQAGQREAIRKSAENAGATAFGIWLELDPETMIQRVRARTGDASDADEYIVRMQLDYELGEIDWLKIDRSKHA